jgi:CBS domain containing-hemolysin-like protein
VSVWDLAPTLLLLLAVLFVAAFVSAAETALFSLRRQDRAKLDSDPGPQARAARDLLARPRALLVAILLVGACLDALFFSVSAGVAQDLAGATGLHWVIPVTGAVAVAIVVLVGEIVPKAIASLDPRPVALFAARPLRTLRDALRLVTDPLEHALAALVDVAERRLPASRPSLGNAELVRFVEHEGAEGRLERRASELLADVLDLRARRVKEVMTPRVDVIAFDTREGRAAFLELLRSKRHGKYPVHDGRGLDRVNGFLRARVVVIAPPSADLARLVEPAWFVPETKTLESLLREMVERKKTTAIVVDEYGGTAGLVTLEDLVEEIVGDIASPFDRPLVRSTGEGEWFLSGRLGLREAGDLLGRTFPSLGPTTISGFLATKLGKVPEPGDEILYQGVVLRVESVARRRAAEVSAKLAREAEVLVP